MTNVISNVHSLLQGLRLFGMKEEFEQLAENSSLEPILYLYELCQKEQENKTQKRIESLLKKAKLPRHKTLEEFDLKRLPELHPGKIKRLCEGDFIDRLENLLIFGNPGTGKTHLAIAFAKEWCLRGRSVLYMTAAQLVQQLLLAKKNLTFELYLKRMDRFDVLIIDDISYVPYEKEEIDVLFLLLSERYEQRSTLITSNLVFSNWNQIFKDEVTTAAAIDRLVHHSTILELNAPSYRMETAQNNKKFIQKEA
jgi:DNA replication protein DnaC